MACNKDRKLTNARYTCKELIQEKNFSNVTCFMLCVLCTCLTKASRSSSWNASIASEVVAVLWRCFTVTKVNWQLQWQIRSSSLQERQGQGAHTLSYFSHACSQHFCKETSAGGWQKSLGERVNRVAGYRAKVPCKSPFLEASQCLDYWIRLIYTVLLRPVHQVLFTIWINGAFAFQSGDYIYWIGSIVGKFESVHVIEVSAFQGC